MVLNYILVGCPCFYGTCRLQRARYASCLAEIQRESSYCETKGEWFFALKNVKQSLKSFLYFKFTRKTVESRQNMQQQKWKTKGDVKLKLYSISELYLFLSTFRIHYNFFTIVGRPGNNTSVPWKCLTIPSNTCNSPDSSKYNNNCVWSKESHILMVLQNPGTIGKRFKKGSEVAAFARLNLPNEQLLESMAFLQPKRSNGMRFETN